MRLITARMPEAFNIQIWRNFREVTDSTFIAELGRWPYMPTWSLLSMYVRNEQGHIETRLVDGELEKKVVHKYGLVWWRRRRER